MIPTLLLPYKFLEYPDITLYPPFRMKSFHIEVLQKQIHEFLFLALLTGICTLLITQSEPTNPST